MHRVIGSLLVGVGPNVVDLWLGGLGRVWCDAALSDGSDNLHDFLVLPLGGYETAFGFRASGEWGDHLHSFSREPLGGGFVWIIGVVRDLCVLESADNVEFFVCEAHILAHEIVLG